MEKITFIIFLLTSFSLINTETISMCECPSKHDAPQTIKVNDKYSPSNVIIDGVNYGKPFVIGDLIFLTKNVAIDRGITELSNSLAILSL